MVMPLTMVVVMLRSASSVLYEVIDLRRPVAKKPGYATSPRAHQGGVRVGFFRLYLNSFVFLLVFTPSSTSAYTVHLDLGSVVVNVMLVLFIFFR